MFYFIGYPINTVLSEKDESLEGNAQHDTMESDMNDEYELNDDMMDEAEITKGYNIIRFHTLKFISAFCFQWCLIIIT